MISARDVAWPGGRDELVGAQESLRRAAPPPWHPPGAALTVAACFVCFGSPRSTDSGERLEPAWAAATLSSNRREIAAALVAGEVAHDYEPGLLALREGPLLEAAVSALPQRPEVVLVNATGRDHPRRAGLALHLGAVLDVPTVGVTDRPLDATGDAPGQEKGATAPLLLDGDLVGYRLRSRSGRRAICVHAGWRADADVAVRVVMSCLKRARTPEPLRRARRAARLARAGLASPESVQ